MGIVPLQYPDGESAESLGLSGREELAVEGLQNAEASEARVTARPDGGGEPVVFTARVRLETPRERDYLRHGGILLYALRKIAAGA
jgi:aconitate hydratase